MSPRSWWRTRPRPDEPVRSALGAALGTALGNPPGTAPATPSGDLPVLGPGTPGAGVPEDPQVARLRDLAAERVTGALHLNGRWGGTVYLMRGEIGHVESALTPGVEVLVMRPFVPDERRWAELTTGMRRGDVAAVRAAAEVQARSGRVPDVHLEVLRRSAMADAALAVLGTAGSDAARARSRFRPGERHWVVPGRTESLAATLDEVARRRTVLARLTMGVRVYWPVSRSEELRLDRVRLSSTQWDVVRLVDGVRSPLDIAWLLGHGVFATTVAVHQLVRLGVLRVDAAGERPRETPVRGVPVAPPRHRLSFLAALAETPHTAEQLEGSRT